MDSAELVFSVRFPGKGAGHLTVPEGMSQSEAAGRTLDRLQSNMKMSSALGLTGSKFYLACAVASSLQPSSTRNHKA